MAAILHFFFQIHLINLEIKSKWMNLDTKRVEINQNEQWQSRANRRLGSGTWPKRSSGRFVSSTRCRINLPLSQKHDASFKSGEQLHQRHLIDRVISKDSGIFKWVWSMLNWLNFDVIFATNHPSGLFRMQLTE